MNISRRSKIIGILLLGAFGLASMSIPSASGFDSTPPHLDSAEISPSQISDAGGSVTVTLKITSNSGLASNPIVTISLPDDRSRQLAVGQLALTSGDAKSGIYTREFQIPGGLKPANYQLMVQALMDTLQNMSSPILTNAYLIYGNVPPTPTSSPTASKSTSETRIETPATSSEATIADLNSTINGLKSNLQSVTTRLKTVSACLASAKKIIATKKGKLANNC